MLSAGWLDKQNHTSLERCLCICCHTPRAVYMLSESHLGALGSRYTPLHWAE